MIFRKMKKYTPFTRKDHSSNACESTFEICRSAEYFLKLDIWKGQFSIDHIYQSIVGSLNIDNMSEDTYFPIHGHDKVSLMKNILLRYSLQRQTTFEINH